jgi:hypothetical protein
MKAPRSRGAFIFIGSRFGQLRTTCPLMTTWPWTWVPISNTMLLPRGPCSEVVVLNPDSSRLSNPVRVSNPNTGDNAPVILLRKNDSGGQGHRH